MIILCSPPLSFHAATFLYRSDRYTTRSTKCGAAQALCSPRFIAPCRVIFGWRRRRWPSGHFSFFPLSLSRWPQWKRKEKSHRSNVHTTLHNTHDGGDGPVARKTVVKKRPEKVLSFEESLCAYFVIVMENDKEKKRKRKRSRRRAK